MMREMAGEINEDLGRNGHENQEMERIRKQLYQGPLLCDNE